MQSIDQGISWFKDRLEAKCVLLILDVVDSFVKMDALAGDWLAPGSRVIIVSRDEHILKVGQFSSECVEEMSELEINEDLLLFSWHTFSQTISKS